MYDFTARNYDPQIGRFSSLDPASQYVSGYIGMGNDPANFIDPSGCQAHTLKPPEKGAAWRPTNQEHKYYYKGDPRTAEWDEYYKSLGTITFTVTRHLWEWDTKSQTWKSMENGTVDFSLLTYSDKKEDREPGYWLNTSRAGSLEYIPYSGGGGTYEKVTIISRKWVPGNSSLFSENVNGLNDALGYAGYGENMTQIAQIGVDALPLEIQIMYGSRVLNASSNLAKTGDVLGVAGNVGNVLSVAVDANKFKQGEISGGQFAYNFTGTATSLAIARGFGGLWGAAALTFPLVQSSFETSKKGVINFNNTITNIESGFHHGWIPFR